MKPDKFIVPNSLGIWRYRQREGPPVAYVCWKPDTSRIFDNKKDAVKFAAWPKSTETGQKLREWIEGFDDQIEAKPLDDFHEQIRAEGFGPEAHEENPVADTKMVT